MFRLASRGSALALWQSEHVKARLEAAHPGLTVEIDVVKTTGDRITDVPLAQIGGRGLFTKEVDGAVQEGRAHAAVHSLKDLPTQQAEGLALAAILEREDPRDVLVSGPGVPGALVDLPAGARIGTSSLRRRAQLLHLRDDVVVEDLRGNLDTRLRRVAEGDLDAAILALAGIRRLGLESAVSGTLDPPGWLPAVGQGAIAVVARSDDGESTALLAALQHADTRTATAAERALLARLEGGCQVPIGALAEVIGGRVRLQALIADVEGEGMVRGEVEGAPEEARTLGVRLAEELLERGGEAILARIRTLDDAPTVRGP